MQRNPQFNNPLYHEAVTKDENEMGKYSNMIVLLNWSIN